jgi:hypothetical protein
VGGFEPCVGEHLGHGGLGARGEDLEDSYSVRVGKPLEQVCFDLVERLLAIAEYH